MPIFSISIVLSIFISVFLANPANRDHLAFQVDSPGHQAPVVIHVESHEQLRAAITSAKPGTMILLEPGEYTGGMHFMQIKGEV